VKQRERAMSGRGSDCSKEVIKFGVAAGRRPPIVHSIVIRSIQAVNSLRALAELSRQEAETTRREHSINVVCGRPSQSYDIN
jgi:hypothetical protein